jgi:hypothetical protein
MNMDLWNNAVGRSYGKRFKTRKALSRELLKALKNGELITNPGDPREHTDASFLGVAPAGTVVVIQQERRGRNTLFFDFEQRCFLTVAEFLEKIRSGKYPRYTIRFRNGRAFPAFCGGLREGCCMAGSWASDSPRRLNGERLFN